jgi:hypothetical protein
MNSIKHLTVKLSIMLVIIVLIFSMCGEEKGTEISNYKKVISCKFTGIGERDGRPIVELVFKNNTGKDLKTVFGGIRIKDKNGEIVQRTGFTYSMPFLKGEEKYIPAFIYIDLKDESLEILNNYSDFIPVAFELSEVIYTDDTSVQY